MGASDEASVLSHKSRRRTSVTHDQQSKIDELKVKFEELLKDDLIDLPEDFYDEELLDTDPEYIPSIFGQLEDKNLKIIRRQQENEQILEQRKYDFERK